MASGDGKSKTYVKIESSLIIKCNIQSLSCDVIISNFHLFLKVSQFWIARQYQKAWSSRSTDFKSSSSVTSSRPSSCNTSACTTPTPFIGLPQSRPNSTRPSSAYASKLSPSTSIRSYSSRSTVSTSGSTMSSMRF